jgi:HD-GYP domain-containing protein (c-di-GMP phosphodiesterase class II)
MSSTGSFLAVTFGVDSSALNIIKTVLPKVTFKEKPLDMQSVLEPNLDHEPNLIIFGSTNPKISLLEMVLSMRTHYATVPIYYATSERGNFKQKELIKNGFTDAFLLPFDQELVRNLTPVGAGEYRPIFLLDIEPNTRLDFDTYLMLPINRKYIRFSSAGYPLESSRAERLLSHQVSTLQISKTDIKKFHDFTASQLKNIADGSGLSETTRHERMHAAIRSLLTGFMTDTIEMKDCAQIVQSYIMESGKPTASVYEKLVRLGSGGGDSYTHASNVATMASLLAMTIAPESVENVALAGLLHDVGLSDVAIEIQSKSAAVRTSDEQSHYERHAHQSTALVKSRPTPIPDIALQFVDQHHERFDGTGYPNKLKGEEILTGAQLVAIADEFDYLTNVSFGNARRSPKQALEVILASPAYDPKILATIASLI